MSINPVTGAAPTGAVSPFETNSPQASPMRDAFGSNSVAAWQGPLLQTLGGGAVSLLGELPPLMSALHGGPSQSSQAVMNQLFDLGNLLAGILKLFAPQAGAGASAPAPMAAGQPAQRRADGSKTPATEPESKVVQDGFRNLDQRTQDMQRRAAGMAHQQSGVSVRTGPGSAAASATETLATRTSTSFRGNGIAADAAADAALYLQANAQGQVGVDERGAFARGSAAARAGATAGASASVRTPFGSASAQGRVTAEAFAEAQGEARIGLDGASLRGSATAGAMARADASARIETVGGAYASASGYAEAGAFATASGSVVVEYNPPSTVLSGKVGAFAGAKAGVQAEFGVPGAKGKVGVEVRAGVGLELQVNKAGFSEGKLQLDVDLGVALGVGVGLKLDLEVDFNSPGGFLGSVSNIGSGLAKLGGSLAQTIGNEANKIPVIGGIIKGVTDVVAGALNIVGDIFAGIGKLFSGGAGDGSVANQAVDGLVGNLKTLQPLMPQSPRPVLMAGDGLGTRGTDAEDDEVETHDEPKRSGSGTAVA